LIAQARTSGVMGTFTVEILPGISRFGKAVRQVARFCAGS
jgi:hypothetical protein